MARWRQTVELEMTDEEIGRLAAIARSRSEPARRVERARMLLASTGAGLWSVGGRLRPGKEPTITPEAKPLQQAPL
jgi:hypothetical protein